MPAVGNISFYIDCGEVLGVVGEGGCGKGATALPIVCLFLDPPGKILRGEILLKSCILIVRCWSKVQQLCQSVVVVVLGKVVRLGVVKNDYLIMICKVYPMSGVGHEESQHHD